jgi:hypothetical protein
MSPRRRDSVAVGLRRTWGSASKLIRRGGVVVVRGELGGDSACDGAVWEEDVGGFFEGVLVV